MLTMADIRGAVARGWCHAKNSHKEMDSDLAEAISIEVKNLFTGKLLLEYATTKELIYELHARAATGRIIEKK